MIFLLFLAPAQLAGQVTADVDPALLGLEQNVASVEIDGHILFKVHGFSSFSAEQRAATICKRIEIVAKDHTISHDSVKCTTETDRTVIFVGAIFIMSVYDDDARIESLNRPALAEAYRQNIAASIARYRLERSKTFLLRNSLRAGIALVLMALLLYLLLWLIRRTNNALSLRIKASIDTVDNKSHNLIRSNQIWSSLRILFKSIEILVALAVTITLLEYILSLFPWTSGIAAYTLRLVSDPLITLGKGFVEFLPSLIFLVVIFFVARYLLRLLKLLFTGIKEGGIVIANFDAAWAMPTFRLLRLLVIAIFAVIAYPHIPGSESNAFKGITVFIGVLFSLGSSSFIGNMVAGYSMIYRKAFRHGDRILVNNLEGFVEDQKLLVTRLRSPKNEEIVIPNSVLLNSTIVNFTTKAKEGKLILHCTVGIGYETPWRQVDSMLKEAAGRTDELLKNPPPFVLKKELGDFAVTYEINAYCNDATKLNHLKNMLYQNILDVFNENDVQIMTPAYEGDPEVPKVVPKDQWFKPLSAD
jgi:small-conductance mechanosensitive channel